MDDDSMYLIGFFMLLFELGRIRKITPRQFLLVYLLMNLIFETLIYLFPVIRGMLFAYSDHAISIWH